MKVPLPAAGVGVDVAAKAGANGIVAAQPVTANEEEDTALGVWLHGSRSELVVAVPQVWGFASGALGPLLRCSLTSSTGNCGFSLKWAVSCPVTGFAESVAASFTITPAFPFCSSR